MSLRDRKCRTCGRSFQGGPRAWYCPDCRIERRRKAYREYLQRKRKRQVREIGSIDKCKYCGNEYIVQGGLQEMCEECKLTQYKEYDRKRSREYQRRIYKKSKDKFKIKEARRRKDLTDNVYGELTVLEFSHNDPDTRSPMWLCRCSCGTEKSIHGYALEHGHYKSCGCKHAEKRDAGVRKHIEQDSVDGTRKSALKAKLHKDNKSGYKGVRWNEQRKKWTAHIGFKGKQISLGYFTNKDDAIAARKAGEEKYHMPYIDKSDPSK